MAPQLSGAAKAARQAGRRAWKRVILASCGAALLALLAWGLWPKPIVVESAQVARAPLRVSVDEDGVARIENRYVVSAPLTGYLERIHGRAGDDVTAGATLARLVPTAPPLLDARTRREAEARLAMSLAAQRQAQVQVERAVLRYAFAQDDAGRKRSLERSGATARELVDQADLLERTSASELEATRFGLQVANREADLARAALGRLRDPQTHEVLEVRAPIVGRILRVLQSSEGVVQAGTPLLELGDPASLEIAIDVLTSDAVRIQPATRVLFERWGGATLEGKVRRVEPSAFTRISALGVEEQRVNVIVDVTSPRAAWASLGDGYRVEARIIVREADHVLQVPGSAVFRHADDWAVFRVRAGVAHLARVELGERTPHAVEIRAGLSANEIVVLHPSDQVHDGVAVALQ
jgi:HlyD family secretion protein